VVLQIAILYDIYLSGGSGQAMLHNTVAAISVLLAAIVVGKGGGGQWHQVTGVVGSGQRHTVDQLSANDLLPNMHHARWAWCILCNKPNRR